MREDAAVGIRAMTLREHGIPASFDLDGPRAIHRHLFQDVYEWVGQVRTANLSKGVPFAMRDIKPMMNEVARTVRATNELRDVPAAELRNVLASIYHATNTGTPVPGGQWTHPT